MMCPFCLIIKNDDEVSIRFLMFQLFGFHQGFLRSLKSIIYMDMKTLNIKCFIIS